MAKSRLKYIKDRPQRTVYRNIGIILPVFLLLSISNNCYTHTALDSTLLNNKSISISLSGELAASAGRHSTADLKAEIEFGISNHVSVIFDIGDLGDSNHSLMSGHGGSMMIDFGNNIHQLQVFPLTLNHYFAIEASDVILVRGELTGIVEAINISRQTFSKIKMNMFWTYFYNVVTVPVTIIGWMHLIFTEIAIATS